MLQQGVRFASLAPNIQVKFPATRAGIEAIERATAAGVSINATVCFTAAQAVAVAEAVERGLDEFVAAGGDVATMTPVCTIMVGRLDDWMRVLVERDEIAVHPDALNWAGIAVFKRAYGLFRERGYRTRLLAAAYRHRLHWTELVGGDVVLTDPARLAGPLQWKRDLAGAAHRRAGRPGTIKELLERIPDFGRAYEPDGLAIDEFDGYGATVRTLRGFIKSYHDLVGAIRDVVLPDPDTRSRSSSPTYMNGQLQLTEEMSAGIARLRVDVYGGEPREHVLEDLNFLNYRLADVRISPEVTLAEPDIVWGRTASDRLPTTDGRCTSGVHGRPGRSRRSWSRCSRSGWRPSASIPSTLRPSATATRP